MGKIIRKKIEYTGGGGTGDTTSVELTQAQYDALSDAEKLNGTVYYVTDTPEEVIPTKVSELTNDLDYQTEGQVDNKISAAISSVFVYRGVVANQSALPSGATVGDVYYSTADDNLFAWDGTSWQQLSGTFDTSKLISNPTNKTAGQILKFDGTNWVASDGNFVQVENGTADRAYVGSADNGYNYTFLRTYYKNEVDGRLGSTIDWTDTGMHKYVSTSSGWVPIASWTADEDTGWRLITEIDPNAEIPFVYRKKNGVMYLQMSTAVSQIPNPTFTAGEVRTIATLPAEYRPTAGYATNVGLGDGSKLFELFVDYAQGLVKLRSVEATTITTSINCSLNYPGR